MKKAFILLLFCCFNTLSFAQDQPAKVDLPEALDRVLKDYEKHWSNFDAESLAQLFTKDGFILRPNRPATRGQEAIAKAYQGSGGPLFLTAYAYEQSGDIAYIIGGYKGNAGGPDTGKFTLTLKMEKGEWKIFSDMDNGNIRY